MNAQLLVQLGEYRELFEERAAIREYDGLQPRPEAEIGAYREVLETIRKDRLSGINNPQG